VITGIEATTTVIAFPGDKVTINCTIRGFPAPIVEWSGGPFEGPVPPDNVIILDAVTSVYQLIFTSIAVEETDQSYTCEGTNLFGNAVLGPSRIDAGSELCMQILS